MNLTDVSILHPQNASVISVFRDSLKYSGGWRELLREVD